MEEVAIILQQNYLKAMNFAGTLWKELLVILQRLHFFRPGRVLLAFPCDRQPEPAELLLSTDRGNAALLVGVRKEGFPALYVLFPRLFRFISLLF
jgi:hypothetical protein